MTDELYDRGMKTRREVVGSEYLDRVLADVDPFTEPLQDLVTKYCWGEVWSRPGLSRRDRSIINLAALSALNRPNELRIHVQGALNNGMTPEEIREVLLQILIYCGAPAALDSFRVAREVIRAHEAERG